MSSYLSEAFKKLSFLNEENFNLNDMEDIDDAKSFMDMLEDDVDNDVTIIDVDAPTEDDLLDSYVGKTILDCCVCHSKLYKNPEDVHIDEEGTLANIDEECPYCFSTDGYKVIGVVAPFDDKESKEEIDVDDLNDGEEIEVKDKEEVEESLNESAATKYLVKVIMHTMEGDFTWYYGKDSKILASDDPDQYKELKLSDVKKYGYDTKEDAMNSERYLNVKNNSHIPSVANIITVSVGTSEVKESLNESADINEYQKWVDYDMEKYHKISDITMDKIKRAGFSVVKDQYGDYEVIADRKDESLKESIDIKKMILDEIKKEIEADFDLDSSTVKIDALDKDHLAFKVNNTLFTIEDPDYFNSEPGGLSYQIFNVIQDKLDDGELNESIDDVTIGLNDQNVRLHSGEDDTTTITLTKQTDAVAPVPDDMKRDIEMRSEEENSEEEAEEDGRDFVDVESEEETFEEEPVNEEEPIKRESLNKRARKREVRESMADIAKELDDKEDKFVDVDVKEFDEESFDRLSESFLKNVYNNVESFKTSNVAGNSKNIVVEGTIKFASGNEKKTRFVFEAKDVSKRGKIRFYGMNENFANSKRPFIISGKIDNAKFIVESMNYNYLTKVNGKSQRISGSVSLKEEKAPKVDLTKIKGTVANLFSKYLSQMEGKSKEQIISDVEKMFKDNNLDTQYTRKKLLDLRKARTAEQVMQQIADSVNYSAGDGVIRTRKSF